MAEVTLTITAEDSASGVLAKVTQGLDKLSKETGAAGGATRKAGEEAKASGRNFDQFATSLNTAAVNLRDLLTPTNLLGAGIGVGLVAALKNAVSAAEAYGEVIRRLQLITGASTQELSSLNVAQVELGGSSETLQRALFLMSREIEAGGGKLKQLGISIRDGQGALKNEVSLLFEVSDSLSSMADRQLAAAKAREIFGRGAADLLPVLLAGSARLKELGLDAERLGVSLDQHAVEALHKAEIASNVFGFALLGIKNAIVQDLLPAHILLLEILTTGASWWLKLPPDIRTTIEVIVGLTASVITLGVAFATLKTVLSTIGFADLLGQLGGLVGIGGSAAATTTRLVDGYVHLAKGVTTASLAIQILGAALAALPLAIVVAISFDVGGIKTKLEESGRAFGRLLGDQVRSLAGLQSKADQLTDEGTRALARVGVPVGGEKNNDLLIAELQERLKLSQKLTEAQTVLNTATLGPEQAQIENLKLSNALKLEELHILEVADKTDEGKAKFAEIRATITKAAAAQTLAIQINAIKTIDAARAESLKVEIAATETGEAKIRDLARAETDAITQQLTIQSKSRKLSDTEIFQAEEKKKQITIKANDEVRKFVIEQAAQLSAIAQKEAETVLKARENEIEHTIAGLDLEQVTRQHAFDTFKISLEQFTAESIANTEATARAKLTSLKAQEDAARNNATRELALAEAKWIGIKDGEIELANKTKDINADLHKKLEEITGQRVKVEDDTTKHILELRLQEAKQTGILFAQEAGQIEDLKRKREQSIQNIGTFLEQQARQTGDFGAAFQVGFAQAASSAEDAFAAMKKAGADIYQALKSGFSDVLFDILPGAKNIGDIFESLGKRILRSFTDVFAEIIAKQTLMAAGFSLPTLLGTAGPVIAATAGFEGAPNQAATAIQQLGTSATITSQALGGVGQVSALLSATLGSLGTLLLTFGSVVLGVIKLFASIGTLGAIGGSPGSAATGLLGTLGSLGSAFGNFASLIQGGLANTIQGVFNVFGAGTSAGIFGTGAAVNGGAIGVVGSAGVAASLLAKAIPIAGGLISIGLDFLHGNIAGGVGGTIGGGIGAVLGGPVGFGIGAAIGSFIGGLFGGLFSGPTPQISGKVKLLPTDLQSLLATQQVTAGQVVNPPGVSNFSFLQAGPILAQMFKFRTQGSLDRAEAQAAIANIVVRTLQEAFKGLTSLIPQLPTTALRQALADKIQAVLAAGFDISSFKFKSGDADEVVQKFQEFLKGLAGQTLAAVATQVFGPIDLAALGAGDVVKGFDALTMAMASLGGLLERYGNTVLVTGDTIAQFATRSIDFFRQFQKAGEAFTDTIKRIMDAFNTIGQTQDRARLAMAQLLHSPTLTIELLSHQLLDLQTQAANAGAQLAILSNSSTDPEAMAQAASGVEQITSALNQAASNLISAFRSLIEQLQNATGLYVDLSISINQLSNQGVSGRVVQFFSELFDRITDVTSRLASFSQMAKLLASDLSAFNRDAGVFSTQFSQLLTQISGLTPEQAIPALQQLAGVIQSTLSGTIDQVHAAFASRRSALEANTRQTQTDLETSLRQRQAATEVRLREAARLREVALQESLRQAEGSADLQRDQIRSIFGERRQALQAELEYVKNIRKFAEGLAQYRQQLTDLLAPTHPIASFDAARAQMRAAFAQFLASPTLETQQTAFNLAKRTVELAQQTPGFDLPSQQFAALIDEVNGILNALEQPSRQVRTEESILSDLKHLDEEQNRLLTEIDNGIQRMRQRVEAEIRASSASLETALQASSAAVEAELQTSRVALQAELDALNQQEQAAIEQLRQVAADRLDQIRSALLLQIQTLGGQTLTALTSLQTLFGVRDLDQLMANNSNQQVQLLSSISAALNAFLQRLGVSAPAAPSPGGSKPIEIPGLFGGELFPSVSVPGGVINLRTGKFLPTAQGPEGVSLGGAYKIEIAGGGSEQVTGALVPGQGIISSSGLFLPSRIEEIQVAKLAQGTDFVPQTGLALLHKGEAVIPASENQRRSSQQVTVNLSPTIHITVDKGVNQEALTKMLDRALAALIVGPSRSRAEILNLARYM